MIQFICIYSKDYHGKVISEEFGHQNRFWRGNISNYPLPPGRKTTQTLAALVRAPRDGVYWRIGNELWRLKDKAMDEAHDSHLFYT
jgi:hypothetical protein